MTEHVYVVTQWDAESSKTLGVVANVEAGKPLADTAEREDIAKTNEQARHSAAILGGESYIVEYTPLVWDKTDNDLEAKGYWYTYSIERHRVQS